MDVRVPVTAMTVAIGIAVQRIITIVIEITTLVLAAMAVELIIMRTLRGVLRKCRYEFNWVMEIIETSIKKKVLIN